MIDFKGKVALITGGSRGIGRSCVLSLARYGCDIAINYHRNGSAAEETVGNAHDAGVTAHAYQADISRPDKTQTLVESVIDFIRDGRLVDTEGFEGLAARNADFSRMVELSRL